MKAVVCDLYGPPEVLRIAEVETPVPADDEVLIRVRATTESRADTHARTGRPLLNRLFGGVRRPKRRVLGHELAGEVDAVGASVVEFSVGDRVFGIVPYLGLEKGTHAELISLPAGFPIVHMPEGLGFEEATAACDGPLLALGCLRKAGLRAGESILVYGASGSIGTAAVQLARRFGARITAVCNTKNLDLVRSLGADEVIDYLHEDFRMNGETYDVVFDAVGKKTFSQCKRSLAPGGRYIPTDGLVNAFWWLWTSRVGDKKVTADMPPRWRKPDMAFITDLVEAGEYRPVIDRTYALEDIVEAARYVETGQKTGNVVLMVA
jgi:NADPH2:quinone reductase